MKHATVQLLRVFVRADLPFKQSLLQFLLLTAVATILIGCGGGGGNSTSAPAPTPTYTVGLTVSGLVGTGLAFRNNGGNDLTIPVNGTFTFSAPIASGSAYSVTASTQPTTPSQTCTVANGSGTMGAANVVLTVTCTSNSFVVNASVNGLAGAGLILQNNGGNDLAIANSGSSAFATAIVSGGTYDIRVLTQPAAPNQRCTVTNGRGSVTNTAITATVTCVTQVPRFAYSVDNSNSTLSIYGVDATTGQLRPRGYVVTGSNPVMATPDPAQRFWFALSSTAATLSSYRHDDVTGDLVEVAGSPYATGGIGNAATGPSYVQVHPSGNFLYVVNASGTNNIAAFAISPAGLLTPIAGSPFAAGTYPLAITIDATGSFAYVTNRSSNNIYTYSIDATTGALTEVANSRVVTGAAPGLLTIHANGRLAYVPNNTDGTISAFTINSTTGVLTAVAGGATTAGANPTTTVAIHASGKFLYLRNAGAANTAGSMSAYTINQVTGALTAIGAPVAIGANSGRAVFDPAGKFLLIANQGAPGNNGSLNEFSINQTTGELTTLTGVPVWPGRPYTVAIDPSGQYVYVTSAAANTHSSYSLDATTGALTPLAQGAQLTGRDLPIVLNVYSSISTPTAATFSTKFAYVTNGNNPGSVGTYQINAGTGGLSLLDTAAFPSMIEPVAAQVDQSRNSLHVVTRTSNALWSYNLTSAGPLTNVASGAFTAGGLPTAVALDMSGRFAYTANANTVSVFSLNPSAIGTAVNNFGTPVGFALTSNGRFLYAVSNSALGRWIVNPSDGALLAGGGITIGGGTTSFALDPSGRFAFVAGAAGIAVYSIDPTDGFTPNTAASTLSTGLTHRAMTVDPTGRFLYSANGTANTVSAFAINQASGALTAIGTPLAAGTNVTAITADYSGKYVYGINQGGNTVTAYAINPTTGALSTIASGGAATGTNANSITLMNTMQ
jgi:6-phosphogluconolactonase (cycloisomerase 2 family)